MEPERNLERDEVYERIPWETLEEKKPDRQWMMLAVAGAIVLGALAYTWTSSRAAPAPATTVVAPAPASTAPVAAAPPAAPVAPATSAAMASPPASPAPAPVMTAEADLYAVHPERAIDRAAAHAEWFVAEYLTVDGSEESHAALSALLPAGVPLPVAPDGSRVFVEWVRAVSVEEIGELAFRVTVLARSLAAAAGGDYVRQPPLSLEVDVSVADQAAQVMMAPSIAPASPGPAHKVQMTEVPEDIGAAALQTSGGTEVVGGVQDGNGWRVIVMAPGTDGVGRPVTVSVPAS
jgi:hypothetical protein